MQAHEFNFSEFYFSTFHEKICCFLPHLSSIWPLIFDGCPVWKYVPIHQFFVLFPAYPWSLDRKEIGIQLHIRFDQPVHEATWAHVIHIGLSSISKILICLLGCWCWYMKSDPLAIQSESNSVGRRVLRWYQFRSDDLSERHPFVTCYLSVYCALNVPTTSFSFSSSFIVHYMVQDQQIQI